MLDYRTRLVAAGLMKELLTICLMLCSVALDYGCGWRRHESLGGWHKTAEKQVKKLAQAVARQTGVDESECCSQATSRLSLLLMKGNSAILINRIPSAPDPVIDGVE